MNITDPNLTCTGEVGAQILMIIFSLIILGTTMISVLSFMSPLFNQYKNISSNLFLSLAYTLSLPLMSYLFSQAEQNNQDAKSQIILIWMVLIEIIHICGDPIFSWRLWQSGQQFVRLFWVGFLVYSYTSMQGLRQFLFVLCIYFAVYEVMKAIAFHKAKNSYLIGKNPKLIHNYMKRIDEFQTTPMNSCDYIVMGEENHEIAVRSDGYVLGAKKSNSEGILTIGRVFQLNSSEDEAFPLPHPYWRDTCLSLALAKILRQRFAKLPVYESGCKKALDFVLEGLIDFIGTNKDIPTDGNDGERIPIERVFSIIQNEMKFVSEFRHIKVLIYHYYKWFCLFDIIGISIFVGVFLYLTYSPDEKKIDPFLEQTIDNPCFFLVLGASPVVLQMVSMIDLLVTVSLGGACIYIQMSSFVKIDGGLSSMPKGRDPAKWEKNASCLQRSLRAQGKHVKQARVYFTVLDVSILAGLPKWIQSIVPRSSPTIIHTDAKECILRSFRNNGGRLTNGETALKNYGMEHLNWACPHNGSTTEAILVWHIATTLFYHQKPSPDLNNDPHQEPSPQHNNNPFKQQKVALALSSYCLYLVAYHPELLPDEVESTENKYASVIKEILAIHWCWMPFMAHWVRKARCSKALQKTSWDQSSIIVQKGVKLANDLVSCASDGSLVWTMLAEYWAELMLFVAPSDNVDGHEKILERREFITQLWALLTHAGIVTRPKPTEDQDHQSESNAVSGEINV